MRIAIVSSGAAIALAVAAPTMAQTYQQTVESANPVANFRLTDPGAGSTTGGYTTTYQGTVTTGPGAPLASDPGNTGAIFDGTNPGIITTSLSGNIPGAGTILAWVNLAALPSTLGHIEYVVGESEYGNDFDLQFGADDVLRFYTGNSENTAFAPIQSSLVGQWHMIAATYDGTLGDSSFRNIYWDGALGSGYTGSEFGTTKTSPFTIGYSSVFGGREFDGSIDEVAVYNHALTADKIAALYDSRLNVETAGAVPEPATWAMLVMGFAGIGRALRRRGAMAMRASRAM